ncbi:MAG: acetyl-CoA carboxylase biotin carboxylase subunit family protein, partial [Gammaproteobacteria bacterium]
WETINAKDALRAFARRCGLPVPAVFDPAGELPAVPLIVKPSEAYSGRGIRVLQAPTEALLCEAIAEASAVSRNGKAVVEEYVEGQLYSHSAFLRAGAIYADFFVEEHCTASPFAVDTSWLVEDLPPSVQTAVRAAIEAMARELGLRDGLVHTQFIRRGERVSLIEITRRCPGDRYGDLINLSTGFPYALNYALPLLGRVVEGAPDTRVRRRVLRHTLSGQAAMSFDAWACTRPLHILRYLPLCTSGERLREGPQGRVGVIFLEESEERFAGLAAAAIRREIFAYT